MIKSIELIVPPEEAANEQRIKQLSALKSGIPAKEISAIRLLKRSVDARSKNIKVRLVLEVFSGELPKATAIGPSLQDVSNSETVVIVGSGPAGLFAALKLIELGLRPLIVERGKDVRNRRRDLANLNKNREVNPDSNYCFGEGGAGTYSDGKLYTRSDKRGNIKKVLDTFIAFGASEEIGIDAHPHIGTNKLPGIIENMRKAICDHGGTFLFETRFESIERTASNAVTAVKVQNVNTSQSYNINCRALILATGHSARDVFELFAHEKIAIECKPLAIGVRIEHPQQLIDRMQYHCEIRSPYLAPASYALSAQHDGRGVYSFCMCPGGIIAAAATAPGELVVNGWSPSKRNNPFANSGMVVSVNEDDFAPYKNSGELRSLRFQQQIEKAAFIAGGSDLTAPAQRVTDFLNGKTSSTLPPCSYIPGVVGTNLYEVLPKSISQALNAGLTAFGKKMRGYITSEAILVATESRTSSPIRIPRDAETLMHTEVSGLFPCGEGAGYAGGIMSAAIDGERIAEKCAEFLHHSSRN